MKMNLKHMMAIVAFATAAPLAAAQADSVTSSYRSLDQIEPMPFAQSSYDEIERDTSEAGFPTPVPASDRPAADTSGVERDTSDEGYPFPRNR